MAYEVEVLKDSVSQDGHRLTTLKVTLPRIVLAEFNTHRMLSRNSASSRAIPVEKRISQVEADPFVPAQFGRNQKGMQATDVLREHEDEQARIRWMSACKVAVNHARALADLGVHKQLANRLIEPFCWQTIVVSATEWSNFFALRCHPDAQPEIRTAAEMMREAMTASTPTKAADGSWHLPFVELDEQVELLKEYSNPLLVAQISCARCARVSYLTHDGRRDPEEDLQLAARLLKSGHMSPFEHAAMSVVLTTDRLVSRIGNFCGWKQYRKMIPHEHDFSLFGHVVEGAPSLTG